MDLCSIFCVSEIKTNHPMMTLRVSGLGHSLTFGLMSSATVRELKRRIEQETRIPVEYQRLLARGSKLDNEEISILEAGIQDRTKIIFMHNDLYAREKEGFEALSRVEEEIIDLASKIDASKPTIVRELVTKICCRLDEVDVMGSATLRARRKALLLKAEFLDRCTESATPDMS